MGLGEFLSLASAAVWAFAVILFKRIGDSWSPMALNLFKILVAIGLLTITIAVTQGFSIPEFTGQELLWLALSGILGIAIADTLYIDALKKLGASRTGIAATMYSPCVVLLSFVLLGERLNLLQLGGFLLVLAGVWLVSYKADRREISSHALKIGLTLAIFSVFLMALGIVMVKDILEQRDFLWIVQLRMIAGALGIIAVAIVRGRTQRLINEFRKPHAWLQSTLAAVLGSYVAMMLWLGGYKYTSASIASVLNETSSIFIVLLAWLLLGESINRLKILAVAFTFGGVLLILTG